MLSACAVDLGGQTGGGEQILILEGGVAADACFRDGEGLEGVQGVPVVADATEEALALPGAWVFDFTGRPMRGWVVVGSSVLDDDTELEA